MGLLIAILMALGALNHPSQYNAAYFNSRQADVLKAQGIIDNNQYRTNESGIVIIDDDVSTGG